MNLPYGHVSSNSFSESENAQLKGSNIGPDANHKLDRSGKANVETTNKRFNKIQGNAIHRCKQEELNFNKRFKHDDSDILSIENISRHIVEDKVSTCVTQYNLSRGLFIHFTISIFDYFIYDFLTIQFFFYNSLLVL
jgi:hypothetical protein